jgi:hypothetical protein
MSGTLDLNLSKTVGTLRKAIKDEKEHAFQHVDADALLLWKVSIPVNRSLTEHLGELDFVDEGSLLPVEELSGFLLQSPPVCCRYDTNHASSPHIQRIQSGL